MRQAIYDFFEANVEVFAIIGMVVLVVWVYLLYDGTRMKGKFDVLNAESEVEDGVD